MSLLDVQLTNKTKIVNHKHVLLSGSVVAIEYYHIPRKRVRTSEIIVDDDCKVTVRTPFNKPCAEVQNLIRTKRHWIIRKQKEFIEQKEKHEINKPSFTQDSTIPYLGKNYPIKIIDSPMKEKLVLKDSQFVFLLQDAMNCDFKEKVKSLYDNWIRTKAEKIIKKKVKYFAKILGVRPRQVVIKNLKGRWGSLTQKGIINLNLNLIKAPEDILDYIILHELCHFKIKEHSHHFWLLVKAYVPDYEKKIKWLQINGGVLI